MRQVTYPRRYRLGLIEAIKHLDAGQFCSRYPRRYRLGLIEAIDGSLARQLGNGAISEALSPRPH